MKKNIFCLILLITLLLKVDVCFSQWQTLSDPTNGNVSTFNHVNGGIYFMNKDTGYIAFDTSSSSYSFTAFIYKTIDGGNSWIKKYQGIYNGSRLGGNYYYFSNKPKVSFINSGGAGILRSVDDWNKFDTIKIPSKSIPNLVYFNRIKCFDSVCYFSPTNDYDSMYKSTDLGRTWFGTGDSVFRYFSFIDKNNGWFVHHWMEGTSFPFGLAQLYRTSNGGQTWQKLGQRYPGYGSDLVFFDQNNGLWDRGTMDSLYKTTDGGLTWQYLSNWTNVIGNLYFISPQVGFSFNNSIYKTVDGGKTWNLQLTQGMNGGLFGGFICVDTSLCFASQSNKYIYKTTNQGGSPFVQVQEINKTPRGEIKIFPNPVKNHTSILLNTVSVSPVSVLLFDVAGRKIIQRNYLPEQTGKTEINFDVNGISPGTYFIRVEQDGNIYNDKLMVH